MEFLAIASGELLLLLGAGVASYLMLRRAARRLPKTSSAAVPASRIHRNTSLPGQTRHALTSSIERSSVELHDLARELQGELDSKARVLQLLIAQARSEAERLEDLLARCEAGSQAEATDSRDNDAEEAFLLREIAHNASFEGAPPHADLVHRLANTGETAVAIAETLGRPLGEVELILSLRS